MIVERLWRTKVGRQACESLASNLGYRLECLGLLGSVSRTSKPDERALASRLCPDTRVLRGPFRGLAYPELEAAGSSLVPKLLGCYEFELHPMLEHLLQQAPTSIVDVGCAEGYYAVGAAMRCEAASVFAFDTDPRARALCTAMAAHNRVGDRVSVHSECSPGSLRSLPLGKRGLIIVDCEGFELDLLDASSPAGLRSHSLIVECHDFIRPNASTILADRFSSTHRVLQISSIDDLERAHAIGVPEFLGLSPEDRLAAVSENRPVRMRWLVMLPRNS